MRISDWSSDVCSSDLLLHRREPRTLPAGLRSGAGGRAPRARLRLLRARLSLRGRGAGGQGRRGGGGAPRPGLRRGVAGRHRSEEHTSELQSLKRISYAVFCLKKNKYNNIIQKYV